MKLGEPMSKDFTIIGGEDYEEIFIEMDMHSLYKLLCPECESTEFANNAEHIYCVSCGACVAERAKKEEVMMLMQLSEGGVTVQ